MFKFLGKVFSDSFKGPSGTYDPARILFGIGGTNGVIAPVAFQIWAMVAGGPDKWDVAAFCLAYGGMLGSIVAAGALTLGKKDKDMAQAQATLSDTKINEDAQ